MGPTAPQPDRRQPSITLVATAALAAAWMASGGHSAAAPAASPGVAGVSQLEDPPPPPPLPVQPPPARRIATPTADEPAKPPLPARPPPHLAAARRLLDEHGAEAVPALRGFAIAEKGARPTARARYLLGRALLLAGRPREAELHLQAAADALPLVADDIAFHLAEAALQAGDIPRARARFLRLRKSHPTSPWAPRAAFRAADADLLAGRHGRARTAYEELLERYPEYPSRDAVSLAIARCLEAVGRKTAAATRLRRLTLTRWDPEISAQADVASSRLEAQGNRPPPLTAEDQLEWGARLHYWKLWPRAEAFLGPLVDWLRVKRPGWGLLVDAHLERGRSFYDWGRYEDALLELRAAQRLGAGRRVLRSIARTHQRLDQPDEAATLYSQLLEGPALHDKLQDMYYDEARYQRAWEQLQRLFELRPHYARKRSYRWRIAWLNYRLGRPEAALLAFAEQADRWKGRKAWRAAYWHARTLERLDRVDEAREEYAALAKRLRTDYYGFQAKNRLLELEARLDKPPPAVAGGAVLPGPGPRGSAAFDRRPPDVLPAGHTNRKVVDLLSLDVFPHPPSSLPVGPERPAARIDWEAGSEREPDNDVDGPLGPSRPAARVFARLEKRYGELFPRLARARDLALLGEHWQVHRELEAALREVREVKRGHTGRTARARAAAGGSFIDHRKEPTGVWGSRIVLADLPKSVTTIDTDRRRALRRLPGRFYADIGEAFAHVGAAHYAKRYLLTSKAYQGGAPDGKFRAHWMRAFPQAYADYVHRYSARYDVPPDLVWAVMTVESSHYPGAVSRANARGLMQVIPKTGGRIARQMAVRGYSAATLSEPEVALHYGCWYLAQLLHKFRGQELLAIAAYNGGPHNVLTWLDRKGHLPADEFIEEIRFTQARGYTKKVLKYLRLYRWIYAGNKTLYVPNELDPRYRSNIRF